MGKKIRASAYSILSSNFRLVSHGQYNGNKIIDIINGKTQFARKGFLLGLHTGFRTWLHVTEKIITASAC